MSVAIRCSALVAMTLLAGFGAPVEAAQDTLPGPITGEVVRVIDGDTLVVRAHIWLGQLVETNVRIEGIDAPELNGRCLEEIAMAKRARESLIALVGAEPVSLGSIRHDKYGGRVIARVTSRAGADLAESLVKVGLARRYDGATREGWCAPEDASRR
jgi:endonuclease YncB( thermonuclease family)